MRSGVGATPTPSWTRSRPERELNLATNVREYCVYIGEEKYVNMPFRELKAKLLFDQIVAFSCNGHSNPNISDPAWYLDGFASAGPVHYEKLLEFARTLGAGGGFREAVNAFNSWVDEMNSFGNSAERVRLGRLCAPMDGES